MWVTEASLPALTALWVASNNHGMAVGEAEGASGHGQAQRGGQHAVAGDSFEGEKRIFHGVSCGSMRCGDKALRDTQRAARGLFEERNSCSDGCSGSKKMLGPIGRTVMPQQRGLLCRSPRPSISRRHFFQQGPGLPGRTQARVGAGWTRYTRNTRYTRYTRYTRSGTASRTTTSPRSV